MTFKHIKFEDSATMRSLARVAKEKGWIKDEVKLSVAEDLSISNNLTENILKLCSGLRKSGMEAFANDVEKKFINYKKSQTTMYDVSGEKGEDLVDAAHPEGSHKLENVDSKEAVIETIIDQQLAQIKMIEKKPTGKLSSNKQILKAVKNVLGEQKKPLQENSDDNKILYFSAIYQGYIVKIMQSLLNISNFAKEQNYNIVNDFDRVLLNVFNKFSVAHADKSENSFEVANMTLDNMYNKYVPNPKSIFNYFGTVIWTSIKKEFDKIYFDPGYLKLAKQSLKSLNDPNATIPYNKNDNKPTQELKNNLKDKLNNLIKKVNTIKIFDKFKNNPKAKEWATRQNKTLTDLVEEIQKLNEEIMKDPNIVKQYENKILKETADIEKVYNWAKE